MKVNEIFYTIQCEGGRLGQPSIFIRLSDCDLACSFCDTEFISGKEMTRDEMLEVMKKLTPHTPWINWCGGEPSLQLTAEDIQFFKDKGYKQSIETSGAHKVPDGLDWVTVSPKVAEHVLKKNFPNGVTELRYPWPASKMGVPVPSITAEHYFISPIFDADEPNSVAFAKVIKICKENPQFKVNVQWQKFLKVP